MVKPASKTSLSDFNANASQTLDRLNASGEPEMITVNGETRGVLIAPAVYDELLREIDAAAAVARIRQSMAEVESGRCRDGFEALNELRDRLRLSAEQREDAGA